MDAHGVSTTAGGEARPLRRDAERNRRRILEAARELFAERGLDVTLDDVARRAGVGVGTVYRRFSGKEDLVEALFEEQFDRIVTRARRALEEEDPWESFTGFLIDSTEYLVRDHGLREVLLSGAFSLERVNRVRELLVPVAEELIHRAQEAGALRPDFADTDIPVIEQMLGAIYHYAQPVRPEVWRRYLTFVLDGLRARPDSTPLPEPALTLPEVDQIMGVPHPGR